MKKNHLKMVKNIKGIYKLTNSLLINKNHFNIFYRDHFIAIVE